MTVIQSLMIAALALLTVVLAAGGIQLRRLHRKQTAAVAVAADAMARARALLDLTLDAILIIGPDGLVEQASPAAARLLGVADGALTSRALAGIVAFAPGAGGLEPHAGLAEEWLRRPFRTDLTAHHASGRGLVLDVAVGRAKLSGGDRLLVSLRDTSERDRIDRITDALISKIGSELRPPLSAHADLLGYLRAGKAGPLVSQTARLSRTAEADARRLLKLLDDLLDIEPIGGGGREFARRPIDLRAILQQATADEPLPA